MKKLAGIMGIVAILLLLGACSSRQFVQVPIDDEGGYYLAETGSATAVYPATPFWYGSASAWSISPYAWAISPRFSSRNWYGGAWYYSPNFYPHHFGTSNQWVFHSYSKPWTCPGTCTPYSDPFRQLLYPRMPGEDAGQPRPVNRVTELRREEGIRRMERMLRERGAWPGQRSYATADSLSSMRGPSIRSSRSGLSSTGVSSRSSVSSSSSSTSSSRRTVSPVRDY